MYSSPCLLIEKSVKLVGKANTGETKAFDRVLDLAYGRKGKLRCELMRVRGHTLLYSEVYLLGTEH
jgi:LYRM2-like protein